MTHIGPIRPQGMKNDYKLFDEDFISTMKNQMLSFWLFRRTQEESAAKWNIVLSINYKGLDVELLIISQLFLVPLCLINCHKLRVVSFLHLGSSCHFIDMLFSGSLLNQFSCDYRRKVHIGMQNNLKKCTPTRYRQIVSDRLYFQSLVSFILNKHSC